MCTFLLVGVELSPFYEDSWQGSTPDFPHRAQEDNFQRTPRNSTQGNNCLA